MAGFHKREEIQNVLEENNLDFSEVSEEEKTEERYNSCLQI